MLQGTRSDVEMLGHEGNKSIYKTVMKLVGKWRIKMVQTFCTGLTRENRVQGGPALNTSTRFSHIPSPHSLCFGLLLHY